MSNRSFIGLADCYMKQYQVEEAARFTGSLSQLQLQVQEEVQRQRNYGREGGNLKTARRVTGVQVNAVFQSVSIANLGLALRAGTSAVNSGTASDEPKKGYLGALIRTDHPNPTSVVVTDDPMTVTYDINVDYKVTGAGIVPLAGGAITEGQDLLLSYSYGGYDVVEALTGSQKEFTLYFDGLNEAEGGTNVAVDLWRISWGTVQDFQLVGDSFINLALAGDLVLDPTRAANESKFFRWLYPQAA